MYCSFITKHGYAVQKDLCIISVLARKFNFSQPNSALSNQALLPLPPFYYLMLFNINGILLVIYC